MAGLGRIPQLHAAFGPNGRLICPHPPCNVTSNANQYWRMRDHILQAHYNIAPWPCPRCPRTENSRMRLTAHINTDHANEANALNIITSRDRDVYQYPATGQMVIIYGNVVAQPPAGQPPVVPAHFAAPAPAPAPVVPAPAFGAGHPANPAFAPHPAFAGHPAFAPQPVPQPGNLQPGYAQPGYAQPGYAQPGYAQPGNAQPVAQPGNVNPPAAGPPAGPPAAPRPAFASLPDHGLLLAQPYNPQAPYVGPAPLPRADPPAFIPPARPTFAATPPPAAAAGASVGPAPGAAFPEFISPTRSALWGSPPPASSAAATAGSPPGFVNRSPAGLAAGSPGPTFPTFTPTLPTFTIHHASPSPPAPAAAPGSSPPGFATPGYMMPFGSSPPAFATPGYNLPYGSPPAALFNFTGPSAPNFNFGSPNMGFATGPTSFQASPNLAAATTGPSGSTFAFASPNVAPPGTPFTFASPNLAPAPGLQPAFASPNPAPAAAPTFVPQGRNYALSPSSSNDSMDVEQYTNNVPQANAVPAHVQDPNIAPPEYFMTGGRSPGPSTDPVNVGVNAQTQQQPASGGRSASSSNDSMDVDQYIQRDVDPNAQTQQSPIRVGQTIQNAPCGSINCRCLCYQASGRTWCHNPARGPGNYVQCPRCQGRG